MQVGVFLCNYCTKSGLLCKAAIIRTYLKGDLSRTSGRTSTGHETLWVTCSTTSFLAKLNQPGFFPTPIIIISASTSSEVFAMPSETSSANLNSCSASSPPSSMASPIILVAFLPLRPNSSEGIFEWCGRTFRTVTLASKDSAMLTTSFTRCSAFSGPAVQTRNFVSLSPYTSTHY